MNNLMRVAVLLTLVVAWPTGLRAEDRDWTWLASAFAPCENVGVTGAYRVNVRATTTPGANGAIVVTNLSAFATSAIFATAEEVFTLSVSILENGQEHGAVTFGPQPPGTVGPAPAATESRMRYAPAGHSLSVPSGAKLRFRASASIPTDAGQCSLGTSTRDVTPGR